MQSKSDFFFFNKFLVIPEEVKGQGNSPNILLGFGKRKKFITAGTPGRHLFITLLLSLPLLTSDSLFSAFFLEHLTW